MQLKAWGEKDEDRTAAHNPRPQSALRLPVRAQAQTVFGIRIESDKAGSVISRFLSGQFAEHLGKGIYEGVWVEGMAARSAVGEVLSVDRIDAVNTFERPGAVSPGAVRCEARGGLLELRLPAKSITVVRLRP